MCACDQGEGGRLFAIWWKYSQLDIKTVFYILVYTTGAVYNVYIDGGQCIS